MHKTKVEIITIGDEILFGQILDTNSQWISQELDRVGIKTIRKTTISDDRLDLLSAFKEAENRADIVLITGGLGPTNDDLTKPCLAEYFDCGVAMHEEALQEVTAFFAGRGLELTDINRKQAELPTCCEYVPNKLGTAPGMWFERKGKVFVSMPGVPYEMQRMMVDTVIPKLQSVFQTDVIHHKIIKTVGIGESWLSDIIKDWEFNLPKHIKLAYLPSLGQVKLRLTATGDDLEQLKAEVDEQIEKFKPYAGKYIYGYDKDQIETAVGDLLKKHDKTIALAESCTGGYVTHMITSVPGSSAYFQGAIVPYHNDFKIDVLGVDKQAIINNGAVSEATIIEMANKARNLFNADIGIATSGIAGPSGGTEEKPVGTVWIAYADGKHTITKKLQLAKDRTLNIKATAVALLNLVRISLPKSIEIKD
ncbi:competence/damage-inducible protein A [Fulvivirga sp. RKSG066]|uniref:competence/damage-inducible protein A n=1 Tax=Fulvivirga aurantia TaxID=2529383 RepID=UPI0012BC19BD|nr:competence/damage-inducible protein A [Fulvivirga aurantia]MTI21445.1 competence/damage-inducible protein A [Fulvivirga aurantia]